MNRPMSRRDLLSTTPALVATGVLTGFPSAFAHAGQTTDVIKPGPWTGFPRQDAKLVAEVVGKSHFNEARVRELVKAHPALVNAWWDWGFGDWESPLGAASHVGRRGIAEFLLENGARIDIFAAAMLGLTDVVKAFVSAQPGVQSRLGPHGITLLSHARAGGKLAADTLAYLTSLGNADVGHKVTPLPADRQETFLGKFVSDETDIRLECKVNSGGRLMLVMQQGNVPLSSQLIHYVGEDEFFPSGVPSVRIKFEIEGGKANSISIRGSELILTGKRVAV